MNTKGLYKGNETAETSSKYFKMKGDHHQEPDKLEESLFEKNQNNIVTSLAEKAMSVAGPVVPVKQDGGVDQERSKHFTHNFSVQICPFVFTLLTVLFPT